MEVMNSKEFEQKDVLIGGSGKTGKFTVNDDPHLMSMLSTSLYENPLKTMIQEIMFNAWDAHRMGKCEHLPIEIHLSKQTGLIVRDYGPGIPFDQIDKIYCTYGQSTKRDDDTQTGGFGLGSKSPYAYNESFMVANHHKGQKCMYIMRRSHDANDGGPGYDLVVDNVPTEESGLMVTVPMKNEYDVQNAFEYLKELLFLSGIKAKIFYDDNEMLIESDSVAPGQFLLEDDGKNNLYAVYGGVKYEIPERSEYNAEYKFLQRLASSIGTMYIGFAPNMLTPLPNREGLNMRERSIESITSALETIQEHFMTHLIPATRIAMQISMEVCKEKLQLQPQFVFYKWQRIGHNQNFSDIIIDKTVVYERCIDKCPNSISKNIWASIIVLAINNTRKISELVGYDKFHTMMSITWAKAFPEWKQWRKYIRHSKDRYSNIDSTAYSEHRTQWSKNFIDLSKKIEDLIGESTPIRISANGGPWNILSNIRRAGKPSSVLTTLEKNFIQTQQRLNRLKTPERESLDCLWYQKDGKVFDKTMLDNHIIIAKTAKALQDTTFSTFEIVFPHLEKPYGYHTSSWSSWTNNPSVFPVAGIVVHKKKGNYDKVLKMLQDMGYTVHEADEPEVKQKPVPTSDTELSPEESKPVWKGYPVVDFRRVDWKSNSDFIKKPTTYLYCTKGDLNAYGAGYEESLVDIMLSFYPNMVMIHNKSTAEKLQKQGAFSMEQRLEILIDNLMKDEDRMRLLMCHYFVHNKSNLPPEILKIPEMQKLMGIPYIRTAQSEKFYRELKLITHVRRQITDRYRHRFEKGISIHVAKNLHGYLLDMEQKDNSLVLVLKMVQNSNLFHDSRLAAKVAGMKPGERKVFAQKIARFLRTV
jgi:hypothetical protein